MPPGFPCWPAMVLLHLVAAIMEHFGAALGFAYGALRPSEKTEWEPGYTESTALGLAAPGALAGDVADLLAVRRAASG